MDLASRLNNVKRNDGVRVLQGDKSVMAAAVPADGDIRYCSKCQSIVLSLDKPGYTVKIHIVQKAQRGDSGPLPIKKKP